MHFGRVLSDEQGGAPRHHVRVRSEVLEDLRGAHGDACVHTSAVSWVGDRGCEGDADYAHRSCVHAWAVDTTARPARRRVNLGARSPFDFTCKFPGQLKIRILPLKVRQRGEESGIRTRSQIMRKGWRTMAAFSSLTSTFSPALTRTSMTAMAPSLTAAGGHIA